MRTVRLIADDLTGALDSAAQFTGLAPLPVLLRPSIAYPSGSFALDLACRDGPETSAVARSRAAAEAFSGADIAFKKIDSLLRGHWAAELAALVGMGLFRRVVLAPAFPAQGRITVSGTQIVVVGASRHPVPVVPTAALRAHGIATQRGLSSDGGHDTEVVLYDAETEDDLVAVVTAARALAGATLWCGTAGLAQALAAGNGAPAVTQPPGPHLVIVGTNHAVASAQVNALRTAAPDCVTQFDEDGTASAQRIANTLAAHGRCVAVPVLPNGVSADAAAPRIAQGLAALVQSLDRPPVLTVVGGETFAALCHGAGADRLIVDGERSPGVPASVMNGGIWDGARCFSKSGAFGNTGWLVNHLFA